MVEFEDGHSLRTMLWTILNRAKRTPPWMNLILFQKATVQYAQAWNEEIHNCVWDRIRLKFEDRPLQITTQSTGHS
jgi:hypothetical protein